MGVLTGLGSGGIVEAVNKPLATRVTEIYSYRKDHVIKKVTSTLSVSLADVLVALLAAGIITYGPELVEEIKNNTDLTDLAALPFGLAGLILNQARKRNLLQFPGTIFQP